MASEWISLTAGPTAHNKAFFETTFGSTALPEHLPAETYVARPSLTAIWVEGKYEFSCNFPRGFDNSDQDSIVLHPGQCVFLEYDRQNAKEWAEVPLPMLHLEDDARHTRIFAGVVHDDQSKLRVTNDMTSIILRTSGHVPRHTDLPIPHIRMAENVKAIEPAGYINHFLRAP